MPSFASVAAEPVLRHSLEVEPLATPARAEPVGSFWTRATPDGPRA